MTKSPRNTINPDPVVLPIEIPLQERAAIRKKQFEAEQRAISHIAFLKAYDRALHSVAPLAEKRDQRAVLLLKLWRSGDPTARSVARDFLALFKKQTRGRPRIDLEMFEIAYCVHADIAERRKENPGKRIVLKDVYPSVAAALGLHASKVGRAFRQYGWWFDEAEAVDFERTQAKGSNNN